MSRKTPSPFKNLNDTHDLMTLMTHAPLVCPLNCHCIKNSFVSRSERQMLNNAFFIVENDNLSLIISLW